MKRRWAITIVALALALATVQPAGASPRTPRWVREAGNGLWQYGRGVAVDDAGNAWMVGNSTGPFPKSGDPVSRRATTAFLAEYNRRGGLTWSTQFGSSFTGATGITRDAAGNLDVVGWTHGSSEFPGTTDTNAGADDAFVRRYDADGNHLWTHLLGSSANDGALGVAEDGDGNIYVVGSTDGQMPGAPETAGFDGDGWIAKYTSDGTLAWVHQLGSDREDEITGVAIAPGGGVDIVGQTVGSLAGSGSNHGYWDVVVAHYSADGTRDWLQQLGTTDGDFGAGIAADASGDLFVVGVTYGVMPGWTGKSEFYGDAFLLELDSSGNQLAVRQFGAEGRDAASAVAVDTRGDVFVTGTTDNGMPGAPEPNIGGGDAFLARFTAAAHHDGLRRAWIHDVGSSAPVRASAVAASADGAVTMAGDADGPIPGAPHFRGESDALIARFSRVS